MTETIERVRLLTGHVDPDTAYVVDDYPYGRTLRCKIRFWIETNKRGSRFMRQTTDPKRVGEPWNKPHAQTYYEMAWLYLDGNGHVQWTGFGPWGPSPVADARFRLRGIVDQLPEGDRARYDRHVAISHKADRKGWQQWESTVAYFAETIRATGEPPELTNGCYQHNGERRYVGTDEYPVAVADARLRING